MQKYLKILEEHCQWIALGLGGLYVLWMVWGFVFQNPVGVEMKVQGQTQTVSPADVDRLTVETVAGSLQSKMASETVVTFPKVPEITKAFITRISVPNPYTLDGNWVHSFVYGKNTLPPMPTGPIDVGPGGKQPGIAQVTALPAIPAPKDLQVSSGRSTVNNPAPVAPPAPGAIPPAAPAVPPAAQVIDKTWVTVKGTVVVADIDKAFKAANIQPYLYQTFFLRVDLVREELDSNGNWGNATIIPPLPITPLDPYPGDAPAASTPAVAQTFAAAAEAYKVFAGSHQTEIVQPPFYQVVSGELWWAPGTPNPNVVTPPTVTPTTPKKQPTPTTPRTPPRLPTGRPPRPGAEFNAPEDKQRPVTLAQAMPGYPPRPLMPPGIDPFENPVGPSVSGTTPGAPLPGSFNPAQPAQPDFEIRAHDDSVTPGKTYRYKLRYKLSNPIHGQPKAAAPTKQNLASVLALVSLDSEWTSPVSVVSNTQFFVQGGVNSNNRLVKVRFDVFRWEKGSYTKKSFDVLPGEEVGVNAEGNDFATGWYLVDIRPNSGGRDTNASLVLLSDINGKLVAHDPEQDSKNPEYVRLKELTAPKPTTPAPGTEGEPGVN